MPTTYLMSFSGKLYQVTVRLPHTEHGPYCYLCEEICSDPAFTRLEKALAQTYTIEPEWPEEDCNKNFIMSHANRPKTTIWVPTQHIVRIVQVNRFSEWEKVPCV